MKKLNNLNKTNLFKKIFIKVCRLLNYEIIDQDKTTKHYVKFKE